MPRKSSAIPGPSRLSQILKHLTIPPPPSLPSLQSLRLTYAVKNNHFGARHFAKEELPRIQYANPSLRISVDKKPIQSLKTEGAKLILGFHNKPEQTIDISSKESSTILEAILTSGAADHFTPTPQTVSSTLKTTLGGKKDRREIGTSGEEGRAVLTPKMKARRAWARSRELAAL
ncbi:hypothetical protein SISNIDRAFT_488459 [Sistotremastrum niveocremeum HHB9708]|uniref:Uncharacterized protein n=1 Tax=Sistotremastrum niveocremeum HHB9708 TaxID=1314777 RepID=A0A164R4K5_9AGAM|nr:hypothetical protein SISNIDRAFT_488459 [Sistotremastrum niveocremeum HHB9708]